jgi:hypothetical protein
MHANTEINTMTHGLNRPNRYFLSLIAFLFAGINHAALADLQPVVVKTYGQHIGGNIVYQQHVTNNGNRNVVSISVALDTDQISPNLPYSKASGELDAFPVGSDMIHTEVNPASISGPTGWIGSIIQIQDSGLFFKWRRPPSPLLSLQPGQTLRFSITVPTYDEAYLTGHFSAGYADGKEPWYYNGVMEKLDTTPPTLSVTLSPSTLWPPNGKLVPVTATISAKDDYDPAPEIKLESITPSELSEPGDISDATLGTDDRQFMLKATRNGTTNMAGRIYTVIYSATDASGNQSIATATVTVPHDERK